MITAKNDYTIASHESVKTIFAAGPVHMTRSKSSLDEYFLTDEPTPRAHIVSGVRHGIRLSFRVGGRWRAMAAYWQTQNDVEPNLAHQFLAGMFRMAIAKSKFKPLHDALMDIGGLNTGDESVSK